MTLFFGCATQQKESVSNTKSNTNESSVWFEASPVSLDSFSNKSESNLISEVALSVNFVLNLGRVKRTQKFSPKELENICAYVDPQLPHGACASRLLDGSMFIRIGANMRYKSCPVQKITASGFLFILYTIM